MYTSVKLNVFTDQHDKLKNDITHQKTTSIKLNLEDNSDGRHTLLLTRGQIAKIERAKLIGKRKMSIHLSKRQVQANVEHQGLFSRYACRIYSKDSRVDWFRVLSKKLWEEMDCTLSNQDIVLKSNLSKIMDSI